MLDCGGAVAYSRPVPIFVRINLDINPFLQDWNFGLLCLKKHVSVSLGEDVADRYG